MKNTFWNKNITLGVVLGLAVDASAADAAAALRVGVAPVSPPMIFKEGGKITGLEADFAQALGKHLGRPIQFVELPWQDLIDALVSDKIDIIMSSMTITRARQFRIAFSEPYMSIGQMALIRATDKSLYTLFVDDASNRTFGLRKGTTGDSLVQQNFPRAKRKYFKSDEEGATALRKGKIDLFIDDSSMIWYLAGVHEADGLIVSPLVFSQELLGWGMRRSDTELHQSVNGFLKNLRDSGEGQRLVHQWIPRFQ